VVLCEKGRIIGRKEIIKKIIDVKNLIAEFEYARILER